MRTALPAAGLVMALAVAAAGCTPAAEEAPTSPVRPSPSVKVMPPPAPGPFVTTGRGPLVPATGAWFGAYVDAPQRTGDRLDAIDGFEKLIGRDLTIAHSFHPWREDFPSTYDYELVHRGMLLMVSWAGTDTRSIMTGVYDEEIRRRAEAVRSFRVPFLLRYRWEMDRPNLQNVVHSPEDFVAAWKRVRRIFTEVGATNAAWVWCPHADGFIDGRAQPYYPGDDEVDWICADVYPGQEMYSFTELMAPVLEFSRQRPRPLLIGEFGVERKERGVRAAWFDDMRAILHQHPQIKGVVYFSGKQDTRPKYDTTLDGELDAIQAFTTLAQDPHLSPPFGH
ncbi:beta-mannanase [Catellatospora sp. NPDC049609]|uniref:glycoside hydrolase family 26 protein n=1 Tax=Catellatospora sp. NPDC049609 TaxID=3155505 RepID=UPI0034315251